MPKAFQLGPTSAEILNSLYVAGRVREITLKTLMTGHRGCGKDEIADLISLLRDEKLLRGEIMFRRRWLTITTKGVRVLERYKGQ